MTNRDSQQTRIIGPKDQPSIPPGQPSQACVVMIYGPELGRRAELGLAPFTIGRSTKNDFPIDQESVSRHHARIYFDGQGYSVQDLGSTNGTYVNDVQVREQRLRDGDLVQIGRASLKFMTGENVELHYHEEIYRLMTVDGLTQIFNRRYFDEAMEREINRARRYQRPLCLLVFDIDHFKKINDTWGHLAGDAVLKQVVTCIRGKLRREDIFARTGGEEFGVLLPEVELSGGRITAERVRSTVHTTRFAFDQTVIPCTISLGITLLEEADTPSQLYARADELLYAAKQGGRNQWRG